MGQPTPGPWRYNPDFDEIQADNGLGLPILAKIQRGGEDRPGNEAATANGLLMAAAPELLAALEALLYQQPESGTLSLSVGWLIHSRLRDLLAKARGER